jgi:hypothetical protein
MAQEFTCFPETDQCISGRFREYWHQHGGLAVFGYPISEQLTDTDPVTRVTTTFLWFERNVFELHPQNRAPYDVLLARLGDEHLALRGISWQSLPRDGGQQTGCLWFQQTGRNVCDQTATAGFKKYWESHGLEFDGKPGKSYEESLALFGLPLTSPRMETNYSGDTVLTQWFERARFEFHPNNPVQYQVLLGLLGNEYPEDEPEPEPEPAPTPNPQPANPCANIAAPRLAEITPNCVKAGSRFTVLIYGFEPNERVGFWITKSTGGTIGSVRGLNVDEHGEFEGWIDTNDWFGVVIPPGDYVFVAQDIAQKFEPSIAPFRVIP